MIEKYSDDVLCLAVRDVIVERYYLDEIEDWFLDQGTDGKEILDNYKTNMADYIVRHMDRVSLGNLLAYELGYHESYEKLEEVKKKYEQL